MQPYRRAAKFKRRGVQTLELILVMPVLIILIVAVVMFGKIMILNPTVTHSATIGARTAGKEGGNMDNVLEAVNIVLSANDIQIADPDTGKIVILEDGATGTTFRGDPNLQDCKPTTPTLNADEVRVTVCIDFSATKTDGTTPVMDEFDAFGFSLSGKRFRASSVVKKE